MRRVLIAPQSTPWVLLAPAWHSRLPSCAVVSVQGSPLRFCWLPTAV